MTKSSRDSLENENRIQHLREVLINYQQQLTATRSTKVMNECQQKITALAREIKLLEKKSPSTLRKSQDKFKYAYDDHADEQPVAKAEILRQVENAARIANQQARKATVDASKEKSLKVDRAQPGRTKVLSRKTKEYREQARKKANVTAAVANATLKVAVKQLNKHTNKLISSNHSSRLFHEPKTTQTKKHSNIKLKK